MRVLIYSIGNLNIPVIQRDDSLSVIECWVGASCAAHPDCKDHTGEMMSMGSGLITELLQKKKTRGAQQKPR